MMLLVILAVPLIQFAKLLKNYSIVPHNILNYVNV